ncbi:hypothetical protein BAA08_16150 [Bizionia sp. APA-3]|nr:hypothetical protein BAA08_16150 [Bizionia sp. APA-3]
MPPSDFPAENPRTQTRPFHTLTVVSNLNKIQTMKKILNLILILFVINIYGQEVNTEYLELRTNLLESNTELVIEFNTICFGGEYLNIDDAEDCVYARPFYIFWTKNGKYFKRKFSNCKIFPESEMEQSELIDEVKKNLTKIEKAEILPVIQKTKNSNGEIETTSVSVDHFCESKFVIHTANEKIVKIISDFDLQTKFIDENLPNDNYLTNQASILNTIFKLAEKEIK